MDDMNDLKATELRVGNYLTHDHCEIAHVTWNMLLDVENGRPYKGIPITKKWLKKLGFKRSKRYGDMKGYELKRLLIIKDYKENTWNFCFKYKINEKDRFSLLTMNRKYIHQLQNLYFSVENDELKIKENE